MKQFLKNAAATAGLGLFAAMTAPIMLAAAAWGEPESKETAREMLPWTVPAAICWAVLLYHI